MAFGRLHFTKYDISTEITEIGIESDLLHSLHVAFSIENGGVANQIEHNSASAGIKSVMVINIKIEYILKIALHDMCTFNNFIDFSITMATRFYFWPLHHHNFCLLEKKDENDEHKNYYLAHNLQISL